MMGTVMWCVECKLGGKLLATVRLPLPVQKLSCMHAVITHSRNRIIGKGLNETKQQAKGEGYCGSLQERTICLSNEMEDGKMVR